MNNNADEHLHQILRQVQQGSVALVLGAGASHTTGGPLGGRLTDLVKKRFPKIDQSLSAFIEVCQDVIDTSPYNRNELEEFIRSKCDLLQPTEEHRVDMPSDSSQRRKRLSTSEYHLIVFGDLPSLQLNISKY